MGNKNAYLLLAVLALWGLAGFPNPFQSIADDQSAVDDVAEQQAAVLNCPDTMLTQFSVKLQDDNAATETYIASSTIYLQNAETGVIESSGTTSSSAWFVLNGTCGETYNVYAVTQAGAAGSAKLMGVKAVDNSEYVRLHTGQMSKMTVKVKDVDGDDWEYTYSDGGTVNVTTGSDLNATNIFEDDAAADIAVGSDGYLNTEVYLKAATNRYYGTDMGKSGTTPLGFTTYVCVDDGTGNEWDVDSIKVTVDGGSALPDVKDSIDDDSLDASYLQSSEACYDIGVIDDTFSTIGFYIKADSGQDPDTSGDDVTLYFLSEGMYKSSDNADDIKTGIYADDSSHTAVAYTYEVPYIVFNIS